MNTPATGEAPVFAQEVLLRTTLYPEADYTPQSLEAALGDPRFRNALWLASAAFYRELEKDHWCFSALSLRKLHTLKKYFNRCCFRPTPFGAFAAFSSLEWGQGPIELNPEPILHLLPSSGYLLANETGAGEDQRLCLNPTLYRLGDAWRYIFSDINSKNNGNFLLNSLADVPLHRELFRRVKDQIVSVDIVLNYLKRTSGCTEEEARDYLDFLLCQQVLLTPAMTGPVKTGEEGFHLLPAETVPNWNTIRRMPYNPTLDLQKLSLDLIKERQQTRDDSSPGSDTSCFYSGLERQVARGQVDVSDQQRLIKAHVLLLRLSAPVAIQALRQFITAFKQRFDRQKVPFLQALDPDSGIRYGDWIREQEPSTMLDGVIFPEEAPGRIPQLWTPQHRLFFQCWLQNRVRGTYEPIVLADADIDACVPVTLTAPMPPSQAILYRKCGDQLWIESAAGASATSLAGRFSAFSDEVWAHCRAVAVAEAKANPGILFAEISQLSETHADNINRRRLIYDQVIPLNVFWAGDPGILLQPDDLVLSVYGEELILESAKLQKRIIPRLPTAYNYTRNQLAPFRLLCDLQHQGILSDLSIDLERLFPDQVFYPRVEYQKVILSPARWKFRKPEYESLLIAPLSISRLHLFREQHGIPRQVCTGLGDQQLVFDLSDDSESLFFLECLKGTEVLRITEHYPADPTVRQDGKAHSAQFVASIVNRAPVYKVVPASPGNPKAARDFPPGSNWLYLKIYCTASAADRLLLDYIRPFLRQHRKSYRSWFFIRYADDGYHLRLRIEGEPEKLARLYHKLGKRLQGPAQELLVRDLRSDTYRRELERYDPALIDLAENSFCAGSEWAIRWLERYQGAPAEQAELAACALVWLTVDYFLNEPDATSAFYHELAHNFAARYEADKRHRVSLDQKYRVLAGKLAESLAPERLRQLTAEPATEAWLNSIGQLNGASSNYEPYRRVTLLADLLHMQINRLFRTGQLRYEAVIYYCLDKYVLRLRNHR